MSANLSEELIAKVVNQCIHYTGMREDKCRAGVRYDTFPRSFSWTAMPVRLPCVSGKCESVCVHGRCNTREEAIEKLTTLTAARDEAKRLNEEGGG